MTWANGILNNISKKMLVRMIMLRAFKKVCDDLELILNTQFVGAVSVDQEIDDEAGIGKVTVFGEEVTITADDIMYKISDKDLDLDEINDKVIELIIQEILKEQLLVY